MRGIGSLLCVALIITAPAFSAPPPPPVPGTLSALQTCFMTPGGFGPERTPASLVPMLQRQNANLSFGTCRDADGNSHTLMRTPILARDGVCQIAESEVFPASPSEILTVRIPREPPSRHISLPGFSSTPPAAWQAKGYTGRPERILARLGEARCGDDGADYTLVVNVPPGLFKAAMAALNRAAASESAFRRITAGMQSAGIADPRRALASPVSIMHCDNGGCWAAMGLRVDFQLRDGDIGITRMSVPPPD